MKISSIALGGFALGAMVLLSACTRVERDAEFRDGAALLKDKSQLFLFSREITERASLGEYRQVLDALSSNHKLDAEPVADLSLLKSIAEPIIEQARKIYPYSRAWQWEYHLASSPDLNAMCYPGGKILVLSGLLEGAGRDPNKLALVLGHEVAHALLEHGRAGMSRDWAMASGMWILAKSFKMGMARHSTFLGEMQTAVLPMSRSQEHEADVLGLELMARAGFDPHRGALIWEDFMARRNSGAQADNPLEAFLSTHPADQERLHELTRLAGQFQSQGVKP